MKKLDASLVYLLASFGSGFIFSLVFGASQIYRVQTVGLDALQLVLVGTTLEVTAFLFEIPTGVVADVYSHRLSIIIGTFLFGLGFLVEGALAYFAAILIAQVIWVTGWTFISGAMQAWIADEVGNEQAGAVYLRSTQLREVGHLIGNLRSLHAALTSSALLLAPAVPLFARTRRRFHREGSQQP